MNEAIPHREIESAIAESTGSRFIIASRQDLGGGCIHHAARLKGEDGRVFFVKQNSGSFAPVFRSEANALQVMAESRTIRVPQPIAVGSDETSAFLVLEYLQMGGSMKNWSGMGRALARMHQSFSGDFGWPEDNWIGSSPQKNARTSSWIDFYAQYRLEPQFRMATARGTRFRDAAALLEALPAFFEDYTPQPSLLHGDLWSGNAGFIEDGTPVVFDPASYYGDREADLALSELFGGFPEAFYSAYEEEWAMDPGYEIRKHLYNLYHVLNHFNIFGGGYARQAEGMMRSLLAAS